MKAETRLYKNYKVKSKLFSQRKINLLNNKIYNLKIIKTYSIKSILVIKN